MTATVAACLLAHAASAQESRGAILGRVTDSSGTVVPAAPVLVQNTATGLKINADMAGVSNTSTLGAGTVDVSYVPPSDVVAEFKVQKAIFDASAGQSQGGSINLSLKSGANALHGTAHYAKMDPMLTANTFFGNPNTTVTSTAFGTVNPEKGYPRRIRLGLKAIF